MPNRKPNYCDSAARAKGDRPPIAPGPRSPLHDHEARLCARWLMNYASRAKIPLSPGAVRKLRQVCLGQRRFDYKLYTAILNYVERTLAERKMRTSAPLRITLGVGGLTLGRR
jgi:hypothetical protein